MEQASSSSSSVDDQPGSTRIARMLENRSNCRSDVEFDIEYSTDHWSELATSETPSCSYSFLTARLRRRAAAREKGGVLINNRFAFVMLRQWGDLRKFIDLKMRRNKNQCGPFAGNKDFVTKVMVSIARDMEKLHSEYNIVHRYLKASNVLLWSSDGEEPDTKKDVRASVVDYECSVGVMGTGFWRAPEILQQLKDIRVRSSEIEFSEAADVYSYGMTCYELLTGCIPFEGSAVLPRTSTSAYDDLKWPHPDLELPVTRIGIEVLRECLIYQPWERPTFSRILSALNYKSLPYLLYLAWKEEAGARMKEILEEEARMKEILEEEEAREKETREAAREKEKREEGAREKETDEEEAREKEIIEEETRKEDCRKRREEQIWKDTEGG